MGGAVQAIEAGFYQDEIAEAAYRISKGIEDSTRPIIGVNKFATDTDDEIEIQHIEEHAVRRQLDRLEALRENRDDDAVTKALRDVEDAARGSDNLLYPMKEALRLCATLGEVSHTRRAV